MRCYLSRRRAVEVPFGEDRGEILVLDRNNQPPTTLAAGAYASASTPATFLQIPSRINAFALTTRAVPSTFTTTTLDSAFLHFLLLGHYNFSQFFIQ
jgi:hypothetical protein